MKKSGLAVPILVLALSASGAWAATFVDTIIDGLRAEGYDEIDVSRTLLGRTRIDATGNNLRREIVLDPRTGEILRDYWEVTTDASGQPGSAGSVPLDTSGSSGSSGGSGGSGSSGSSGSNSGKGSGSGSGGGSGGSGSGSDDTSDDD